MIASNDPTLAGNPSSATIFNTVPDAGAGISVSTLSVLTSRSGSSSLTGSPSFFSHLVTVTSSTPSPNKGTRTFVAIIYSSWLLTGMDQFVVPIKYSAVSSAIAGDG